LQSALSNISTGTYRTASVGETVQIKSVNDVLSAPEFKGSVDVRKRK
jgi:hypothetical protein